MKMCSIVEEVCLHPEKQLSLETVRELVNHLSENATLYSETDYRQVFQALKSRLGYPRSILVLLDMFNAHAVCGARSQADFIGIAIARAIGTEGGADQRIYSFLETIPTTWMISLAGLTWPTLELEVGVTAWLLDKELMHLRKIELPHWPVENLIRSGVNPLQSVSRNEIPYSRTLTTKKRRFVAAASGFFGINDLPPFWWANEGRRMPLKDAVRVAENIREISAGVIQWAESFMWKSHAPLSALFSRYPQEVTNYVSTYSGKSARFAFETQIMQAALTK